MAQAAEAGGGAEAATATRGVGAGARAGGGTLRVNLQACSSTDRSASDGVLHVLSFVDDGDGYDAAADGGSGGGGGDGSSVGDRSPVGSGSSVGIDDDNSAAGGEGNGGISGSSGMDGVDGAGVLVPDVLELAHAFGFRKMYEAVVSAAAADKAAERTMDVSLFSTGPTRGDAPGDAPGDRSAAAAAAEGLREEVKAGPEGEEAAPPVSRLRGDPPRMAVADALRGPAAHTLLAVADSGMEQAASRTERSGLSAATLR